MTEERIRQLPDQSGQCLACACENVENLAGQEVLRRTGATSSVGVLAAIFVTESAEHEAVMALARDAILEQRSLCERNGLFKPDDCPMATDR